MIQIRAVHPKPADRTPVRPHVVELRALARLTLFATVLGVALLALLAADRALPTPPLTAPASWPPWLTQVGPAGGLMSAMRLLAVAATSYLLVVVTVELIGRAVGLPHLLALGRFASAPAVRRLVHGVAGVGLAASLAAAVTLSSPPAGAVTISMGAAAAPATTSPTGPGSADPASPTGSGPASDAPDADAEVEVEVEVEAPMMRALDDDDPAGSTTMTSTDGDPAGPGDAPVMRTLDDPLPTTGDPGESALPTTANTSGTTPETTDPGPPSTPRGGADGPERSADRPTAPAAPSVTDRWVIERGDHLWGVARRTLAGSWHRPPTDGEVTRYLHEVIDANLDVLVVPGDADLVLVGQVFTLPPVPAA